MMGFRQLILALLVSAGLIVIVLELIRRRKLKERYSFLWLLTGFSILVLVLWYNALVWITEFFKIQSTANTIFFLAVIFLTLICLHFSVKISSYTDQIKTMAQEIGILKMKLRELSKREPGRDGKP